MFIFISPDRTQLPSLPNSQNDTTLEELTGADIAISQLPIPPSNDINLHIKNRTLFIQIKIGYDALSFDAIHNFCARVQEQGIPQNQAILLYIGEHWCDDEGYFRIRHQLKYGEQKWVDFRRSQMAAIQRGITIYPENLKDISELPKWIDDVQAIHDKFKEQKELKLYPKRIEPTFEIDNLWQLVEEVPPNTMDYLLCAGVKGIGQKTIDSIREYFEKELPHLPCAGHYMLSAMIDMEDGKFKHNIPNWGAKRAQFIRDILLLPDNINLSLNGKLTENEYQQGWEHALKTFKDLIEDGHSVKDSFNACIKLSKDLAEF